MEQVQYNGWQAIRLANREVELIVTRDVGPRILRFGFIGGPNLFAEFADQQGGRGESEWQIRGGHRLWIAPEEKPWSYELDNAPYACAEAIPNGVRTEQAPGPITGIAKQMEIRLDPDRNEVTVVHTLTNRGDAPVRCSVWALTVMAGGGQAIIPLPAKVPHTACITPAQNWSLWSYTVLNDPRFTFGRDFILFRQDPALGPNKLGLKHREGWAAYQNKDLLFVKRFACAADAVYPDGDVNFEVFSNEFMLEVESLGPLVSLRKNESASHTEVWQLSKGVPPCQTEADVARHIQPRITGV